MIRKFTCLLLLLNCLLRSDAQLSLEPVVGYAMDLRAKPDLNEINTNLQLAYYTGRSHLLVIFHRGWGVTETFPQPLYTNDPALPRYATGKKTLSDQTTAVEFGWRITIIGPMDKSHVSVVLRLGFSHEAVSMHQYYDRTTYALYSTDLAQSVTGFVAEAGAEYTLPVKFGDLFLQVMIADPPSPSHFNYSASYKLMVPLSLNIGYSIPLTAKHTST